ncbi:Uncharacterized protein QTN25_000730 [Entamoeba marina]
MEPNLSHITYLQSCLLLDQSKSELQCIHSNKQNKQIVKGLICFNKALTLLASYNVQTHFTTKSSLKTALVSLQEVSPELFQHKAVIVQTLQVRFDMLDMLETIRTSFSRAETPPLTFVDTINEHINTIKEVSQQLPILSKQVIGELCLLRLAIVIYSSTTNYDVLLFQSSVKDVNSLKTTIDRIVLDAFPLDSTNSNKTHNSFQSFQWRLYIQELVDTTIKRAYVLLGPPSFQPPYSVETIEKFCLKNGGGVMILHFLDRNRRFDTSCSVFIDNAYGNTSHPISLILPEIWIDEYEYWLPCILTEIANTEKWGKYLLGHDCIDNDIRTFVIVKCKQTYFIWITHDKLNKYDQIANELVKIAQQVYFIQI